MVDQVSWDIIMKNELNFISLAHLLGACFSSPGTAVAFRQFYLRLESLAFNPEFSGGELELHFN